MRLARALLIGLVAVLVPLAIAAWTFPAELAYQWFGARLAPVTLAGMSGTAWQGHAQSLRVLGQELGQVDWRLGRNALFGGDLVLHADVSATDAAGSGSVDLVQHADRTVDIHGAHLRVPAALLEPALGIPALRLVGTVTLDISDARLRGLFAERATGTAVWHDAAVAGAAQARLSDLQVNFSTLADGRITCRIFDLGGPLAADGRCEWRAPSYHADVRLAPRDGDARVADALQFVGQPQADGSVMLKIDGRVLPFLP